MSEASDGADLEDVRAQLVDAKDDVANRRNRCEINLAISALDAARAVDGKMREFVLRDCQHHCRSVGRRIQDPGVSGQLLGTARMVEEVISS